MDQSINKKDPVLLSGSQFYLVFVAVFGFSSFAGLINGLLVLIKTVSRQEYEGVLMLLITMSASNFNF